MSKNKKNASRYNKNKPKYSIINLSDLEPLVKVLEFGAAKYSRNNWKKGLPIDEILDSLLRHIAEFQNGQKTDQESKLPITSHILANALFLDYHSNKELKKKKKNN